MSRNDRVSWRAVWALAALLAAGGPAGADGQKPAPGRKLFVAPVATDYVEVIDLEARKPVQRIKVGESPHGLAVHSYLAGGQRFSFLHVTTEQEGELVIVSLPDGKIRKRLRLGQRPHQLVPSQGGLSLFVPLRNESAVAKVALRMVATSTQRWEEASAKISVELTPTLEKKIAVSAGPHNAYRGATTGRIYVGALEGKKLHVLDPETLEQLYEIEFPHFVRPIALTRDERRAYVALSGLHGFVVVDLEARAIVETVELPPPAPGTAVPLLETMVHGMILSPDERELWVASTAGSTVFAYSIEEKKIVAEVPTAYGPFWFAWEPRCDVPKDGTSDGRGAEGTDYPNGWLLWVSEQFANQVSAIDPVRREIVASVPTGRWPRRILVMAEEE
jgi:DNA-binding beta-propeller fold protein YncE